MSPMYLTIFVVGYSTDEDTKIRDVKSTFQVFCKVFDKNTYKYLEIGCFLRVNPYKNGVKN